MKNIHLSILISASLIWLILMPVFGVQSMFLSGLGALCTLVFGSWGLSRIYQRNHRDWFPYSGGVVMLVFWSYAVADTSGLVLIAPIYMIILVVTAVKLYRV